MVSMYSEKPIYVFHPIFRSYPNVAFETVPMFASLTMALSRPLKENRPASLMQAIDGVIYLALCPQIVYQAPQHFKSSEKQAPCDSCLAYQSICSAISFHSGRPRAVHPQRFPRWMSEEVALFNTLCSDSLQD